MIDLFVNGVAELTSKDKEELSAAFYGLSGANVEEIVKKSIRNAVIHNVAFTRRNIYEELFIFRSIVPQSCNSERDILRYKAKYLRECSEKVFSLQTIADILGSSKTTISKIIKEANES